MIDFSKFNSIIALTTYFNSEEPVYSLFYP